MDDELLSLEWDKSVGRRQPPLRAFLVYNGLSEWLKGEFGKSYHDLFLVFSRREGKDVTTDSFVSVGLREELVGTIIGEMRRDAGRFDRYIGDFRDVTDELLEFSRGLDNPKKDEIGVLFDRFCASWGNFGPALLFILFLEEACEREKRPQLLKKLAGFRDWRKRVYEDCWYRRSSRFFELLGNATGLGENVGWAEPFVIRSLLEGKGGLVFKNDALLSFSREKGAFAIEYGKPVAAMKEKIMDSLVRRTTEIRGRAANGGFTRGKVRIIEPHKIVDDFESGEVVVSRMTTPDLIEVVRKASAIVTDEGGLTSHAATTARELNIPCIVGTKVATSVFRDGDLVEVDANRGTVKKAGNPPS